MPSGSAMKLGDVLTIRGGTTVEIHNTDAEGRLVLADGLVLASRSSPTPSSTSPRSPGRAWSPSGRPWPACSATTSRGSIRSTAASDATDEPVWQLPLEKKRYRKLLDSDIADLKNVGGPYGGAITAAVFLSEFVGDVPWAHLDIAGPMKVDADEAGAPRARPASAPACSSSWRWTSAHLAPASSCERTLPRTPSVNEVGLLTR